MSVVGSSPLSVGGEVDPHASPILQVRKLRLWSLRDTQPVSGMAINEVCVTLYQEHHTSSHEKANIGPLLGSSVVGFNTPH